MTQAENFLSRLDKPRQTGPGRWLARCPAHDDRSPSLGVRETDEGAVLVHCWGGCETAAVLAAVGLSFADLFPPKPATDPSKRQAPPKFRAAELLELAAFEAEIVAMAASHLRSGRALSEADAQRLDVAIETLQAIHREATPR